MRTYDPNAEHKVDISAPEIQEEIATARGLYDEFLDSHARKLDLGDPATIDKAFEAATWLGVFEHARAVRKLVFGTDMHFYGVVYLWDACVNSCSYCPGSLPNRQKAIEQGNEYALRELSVKQAVIETRAVMANGHTHVCYLAGSAPGRRRLPDKLSPYLSAVDDLGLDEIILNMEAPTAEGFATIRRSIRQTPVQFRVFQETYDRETYAQLHPCGPKSDYDFRRGSQGRAVKAGFDNVGIGALFGLHQFPLEEIESLRLHAEELEKVFGKRPARVCLPSANELKNIGVDIPFPLERGRYTRGRDELLEIGHYEHLNELLYALARLTMPDISIVSSERDGPAMLRILDAFATCTTLNVHSGVGENTNIFGTDDQHVHFEQTTDFPRDPETMIMDLRIRGFRPMLNLE